LENGTRIAATQFVVEEDGRKDYSGEGQQEKDGHETYGRSDVCDSCPGDGAPHDQGGANA
jgi:hypothetical protein